MSSRKGINKEIDNYIKGNYSKKIAIELLKRDGFSESEINEHITRLDNVEKSNEMNSKFVPGFIFILILTIFFFFFGISPERKGFDLHAIAFIGFILALPLNYFYYKGNKAAIALTGFAILCVIAFEIVSLFTSQMNVFNAITSILFLILILISVKNYYKSF